MLLDITAMCLAVPAPRITWGLVSKGTDEPPPRDRISFASEYKIIKHCVPIFFNVFHILILPFEFFMNIQECKISYT